MTGLLLVWDLRQPKRFLWTLTRPQWRSWLVRGAYVIAAYGALLGAARCWRPDLVPASARRGGLTALTALLAAGTAVYTRVPLRAGQGPRPLAVAAAGAAPGGAGAGGGRGALPAARGCSWLLPLNGLLVAAEVWGRHPDRGRPAGRAAHPGRPALHARGVLAAGHLLPLALLWAAAAVDSAAWPAGLALARPAGLGAPLRAGAPAGAR